MTAGRRTETPAEHLERLLLEHIDDLIRAGERTALTRRTTGHPRTPHPREIPTVHDSSDTPPRPMGMT